MLESGIAFSNNDYAGGLGHLAAGLGTAANFLRACFVAGTPVRTPSGSKPVESLRRGDWVLARDEHDPAGEVRPRRVLQCFVRVSPVLTVVAGGREVGTTGEHPFWCGGAAGCRSKCADLGVSEFTVSDESGIDQGGHHDLNNQVAPRSDLPFQVDRGVRAGVGAVGRGHPQLRQGPGELDGGID